MPKQSNMRQNVYKVLLGSFVFAMYCWRWGLCLTVICFPNKTPLEKTMLCFASSCLRSSNSATPIAPGPLFFPYSAAARPPVRGRSLVLLSTAIFSEKCLFC